MYGSMVDIQSATAENRQGKKESKKDEATAAEYNGLSVRSFIRLTRKTILITLKQPKRHTVLSTFRLHAGSLHQD